MSSSPGKQNYSVEHTKDWKEEKQNTRHIQKGSSNLWVEEHKSYHKHLSSHQGSESSDCSISAI